MEGFYSSVDIFANAYNFRVAADWYLSISQSVYKNNTLCIMTLSSNSNVLRSRRVSMNVLQSLEIEEIYNFVKFLDRKSAYVFVHKHCNYVQLYLLMMRYTFVSIARSKCKQVYRCEHV